MTEKYSFLLFVFVRISHLALHFYDLNIHELAQIFWIWCEMSISGGIYGLDWTRLEKPGKIRKKCYQTLFLVLTPFNIQNKGKLHSDQVSRHSISKKYDFKRFSIFHGHTLKMGIIFLKNQKVAFLCKKTGSNGFPVAN